MNNELYNSIKEELNSLEGESAKVNNVCALLNEKLKDKTSKDIFTTTYAFYEYMIEKEKFNFIKAGEWKKFFQDNISNFLTFDVIKDNFDNIIKNENLLNTILNICTDEVKQNLCKFAKEQNDFYIRTGSNKYVNIYSKINEIVNGSKIITPDEYNLDNNIIEENLNDLRKKQDAIEKKQEELNKARLEKRDELFDNASSMLGINSDSLINKIGKEESLKVDNIQVSSILIDKMVSNNSKAASCPQNIYRKLKENINKKVPFVRVFLDNRNIKLTINEIDGKNVLQINKRETVFDKIASCDNAIIRSIASSSKRKLKLFKSLITPDKEVINNIKSAISNTNEKVVKLANDVKEKTHDAYVDLKDDVKQAYNSAKDNFMESYSQAKQNLEDAYLDDKMQAKQNMENFKGKISDALYNVADKIKGNTVEENKILQAEDTIENDNTKKESYFYTKDGKKVIVRAGTKVLEKEKPHVKVA